MRLERKSRFTLRMIFVALIIVTFGSSCAYRKAMHRAETSVERQELELARLQYRRALEIRPNEPTAVRGLARVNLALAERAIADTSRAPDVEVYQRTARLLDEVEGLAPTEDLTAVRQSAVAMAEDDIGELLRDGALGDAYLLVALVMEKFGAHPDPTWRVLRALAEEDVARVADAMKSMDHEAAVRPLIDYLAVTPAKIEEQLGERACEVLGSYAVKARPLWSIESLEVITRALLYGLREIDSECSLTVQKIGPPTVPLLLAMFRGQRQDVADTIIARRDAEASVLPANFAQVVAAQRLRSLRAPEAAAPFMAELDEQKNTPLELSGRAAVEWRLMEARVLGQVIGGLGDLGHLRAAHRLVEIANGEYVDAEWAEVTDWFIELQLRRDAMEALNALGDRTATDSMLELAETGVIEGLETFARNRANAGQPLPTLERFQLRWQAAISYAYLTDGDNLDEFVGLARRSVPGLSDKIFEIVPVVELAQECHARGSVTERASCFGETLSHPDAHMRAKAAFELGRLPPEVAAPIIRDRIVTVDSRTRSVLIDAIYRLKLVSVAPQLDYLIEAGRLGPSVAVATFERYQLRLVAAYLDNLVYTAQQDPN